MNAQVLAWSRAINRPRLAIALLVFALALAIRINGISQHFWLLGDQIRDWAIALRPFSQLPLVGPPTHVGGYTIGPAFYWTLWFLRVLLGPWFDNLPHAGGIGQAALQSAADALLLVAIWRRTGSPWIALATIVIAATAAFDVSLASLVWNPPMGAALAKLATAAVLADWHRRSAVHVAVAAAVAWSAVHAYTGAIFVVLGVFAAMLIDPFVRGDRRLALRNAAMIAVAVVLLQLPLIVFQLTKPRDAAMGAVSGSLSRVLSGESPPEIAKSLNGYVEAVQVIEFMPGRLPGLGWLLLISAGLVTLRYLKDPALLSVTVLPQVAAIAGYSLFLDDLDAYYYLSLMPATVLTFVLAVTAMPAARFARATSIVTLVAALAFVPMRVGNAATMFRMPQYRILVDASRKVRSFGQPMQQIRTDFALPPSSNAEFLFEVLGGTIDRRAPWVCVIRANGEVTFSQVPVS
ncbi:MAG TPA: hypothetical protein VMS40_01145, partial [Vicinamibacterales bacterium]|nr:hypothetical protein [Vicinamibacterales bacterium]